MRRLTEKVKRRIVEHLACYHSPAEVTRLIEEEFGITLTARHVRAYDPTSPQCTAAQRWAAARLTSFRGSYPFTSTIT